MWYPNPMIRCSSSVFLLLVALTTGTYAQWAEVLRSMDTDTLKLADEIPQLGMLLGEDPLDTSLADAVYGLGLLDGYVPFEPIPFRQVARNPEGAFPLPPGTYRGEFESYCLKAGTYGPGGGDGYLDAPLRGPQADIIRSILKNSFRHPQLSQPQIQGLLWAVVSRSGVRDMSPDLIRTAAQLLTPTEILRLNGAAIGWISSSAFESLLARAPVHLRGSLEAGNQLRRMLGAGASYESLVRIAILEGLAPWGEGSRKIPSDRWAYHPDGYFLRFLPESAHKTRIEVLRPRPFTVERDTRERIVAVADTSQNRIEVEYDDARPPIRTLDSQLLGYPFRLIRFIRSGKPLLEPEVAEWKNSGWTWMGWAHEAENEQLLSGAADTTYFDHPSRLATAFEQCLQVEQFFEIARQQGLARRLDPYGLADLVHFSEGVRAAPRSGVSGNQPWISEHLEMLYQAVAFETCRQVGGCSEPGSAAEDRIVFDPAEHLAVPANTSRQRLGLSARLR